MNIQGVSFRGTYPIISCKNTNQADKLTKAINGITGNIEAIKRSGKDVLIIESSKKDENAKKIIHLLEDCTEGFDKSGRDKAAEAYYKASKYRQVYDAQMPTKVNAYR